jgi:hypothetical protein
VCAPRGLPGFQVCRPPKEEAMRVPRYAAASMAALALAGAGFGSGVVTAAPPAPKIPVTCVAPLNGGSYKTVPDGDAERYDTGVYVCAKGLWILDEEYGQ